MNTRDIGSAIGGAAVSPANGTPLPNGVCRALWVGGSGNIALTFEDGSAATLAGVPCGTILQVRAKIVAATGTTATNIVALY